MFDFRRFQEIQTGKFGSEMYFFDQIESTNSSASEGASRNMPDGTVILADHQTRGRGRNRSAWYSPQGTNLYFSVVLRPQQIKLRFLPFLTALSLIRTLNGFGIQGDLKWPNDVLVNEKKIAGILIETAMEENRLKFAVIGIGINVNETRFPTEIADCATSIKSELHHEVSRESILFALLSELESAYSRMDDVGWEEFCRQLEQHSSFIRGCGIRITHQDEIIEGKTAGLDEYGGLILDTGEGRRVFYSGEVQRCRKT